MFKDLHLLHLFIRIRFCPSSSRRRKLLQTVRGFTAHWKASHPFSVTRSITPSSWVQALEVGITLAVACLLAACFAVSKQLHYIVEAFIVLMDLLLQSAVIAWKAYLEVCVRVCARMTCVLFCRYRMGGGGEITYSDYQDVPLIGGSIGCCRARSSAVKVESPNGNGWTISYCMKEQAAIVCENKLLYDRSSMPACVCICSCMPLGSTFKRSLRQNNCSSA